MNTERKSQPIKDFFREEEELSAQIADSIKSGADRKYIRENYAESVLNLLKKGRDVAGAASQDEFDKIVSIVTGWVHNLSYYLVTVPISYLPEERPFSFGSYSFFDSYSQKMTGRQIKGLVVAKSSNKTAKVEVTRRVHDSKTGKYLSKSKRYQIHDEHNSCQEGDVVTAVECPPVSATKHFVLQTRLGRNESGLAKYKRRQKSRASNFG